MPRVLIINDPHYTRFPPQCRSSEYHFEVLKKFKWVGRIAKKLKASMILCTGDWFHRKGKVTFRESNDMLSIFNLWRDLDIQVAGILGNHDIAGHSLESMDSRAVGTFVYSGSMHLLDHGPIDLEDETGAIRISGTSYFHGCDSDDDSRLKMYGSQYYREGAVNIHLAHGTLIKRGEFFGEFTTAKELEPLLRKSDQRPDILASGHLHFNEGVYEIGPHNNEMTICRTGSLSRVSKDDFDRIPSVVLVATKGAKFVCKEIPVDECEKLEIPEELELEEVDVDEDKISSFIDSLRAHGDDQSTSNFEDYVEKLGNSLGFDQSVIERAIQYVRAR
jgi:DNA repair exonuclease SbcCD nuclease subunit